MSKVSELSLFFLVPFVVIFRLTEPPINSWLPITQSGILEPQLNQIHLEFFGYILIYIILQ